MKPVFKVFSRSLVILSCTLTLACTLTKPLQCEEGSRLAPHNIILLIGDGMGLEHVKAGRILKGEPLSFETFPYQGQVTTSCYGGGITDSAAAATAIATGTKVSNGTISLAQPGDGHELQTLLEYFKARNKSVGLVTSASMSGATPAAFGAHENSRNNYTQIINDYLTQTQPQVLLGGGSAGLNASNAQNAGYTVVNNRANLLAINTEQTQKLSGQFGGDDLPYEYDGLGNLPHLHEMASVALNILDNNPNGFFLMIESGQIDDASHSNDSARFPGEVIELSETVSTILNWLPQDSETLILVTADHETGGLQVLSDSLLNGQLQLSWSSGGHTSAKVGVFAHGYGAELFSGDIDNTDFFSLIATAGQNYNQAPTVNAGPDESLRATRETPSQQGLASYQLQGSIEDDGISTSSGISALWSQESGPATATLVSNTTASTDVVFPLIGDYVFKLTANDGFIEASDTVKISVLPYVAPSPTATVTATATATTTATATFTATSTPTAIPSAPPTQTATAIPSPSNTPIATLTATATASPVANELLKTNLKLLNTTKTGHTRLQLKASRKDILGHSLRIQANECQTSLYLISSQRSTPSANNRLYSKPAMKSALIVSLPKWKEKHSHKKLERISIRLLSGFVCKNTAEVFSAAVPLLRIYAHDESSLFRYWRNNLAVSAS